ETNCKIHNADHSNSKNSPKQKRFCYKKICSVDSERQIPAGECNVTYIDIQPQKHSYRCGCPHEDPKPKVGNKSRTFLLIYCRQTYRSLPSQPFLKQRMLLNTIINLVVLI